MEIRIGNGVSGGQGAYHPLGSVSINGFQQSFTTQSNKLTFTVDVTIKWCFSC